MNELLPDLRIEIKKKKGNQIWFENDAMLYCIKKKEKIEERTDLFVPKLSDSKLKDLAWSLDIQESIYSSKDQQK